MKKSWILLSVALVSIFLGAVTLLTVTRLKQQQPVAPTVPEPQQAVEPTCRVSFDLYPAPSSSLPPPSGNRCAGVPLLSANCTCTTAGMNCVLSWNHVAGVTDYAIAFDDDPNFWTDKTAGNEVGADPWAEITAGGTEATRTFSRNLNNAARYFRVRVRDAGTNACVPCDGCYGATVNKGPIPCPSPNQCTGVNISCAGQCTASGGVDYTCNWTKPAGATEFAMAYKDTTASSSAWKYEISNDTLSANRWLNDKTRWVKSFTTNVSRDFMLRVYTSTTCTPHVGAYGNRATVAACTPIGGSQASPTPTPTPSPSATPVPQCNQSCTTNAQCPSNLLCYIPAGQTNGNCRLPVCQTDTDCSCNPSPSPTVSPAPSVIPGVPKAGTSWPTIFLIVGGLALLVLGFALP